MFHKTLLSLKDLNKIPKLGKQIKTRQLRSIFHHLLLLSKIVQLFLQNKNKIVHTGHIHHIFLPMALAHPHPTERDQKNFFGIFFFFKKPNDNNKTTTWPHPQKMTPGYTTKQEVSSALCPKDSSPCLYEASNHHWTCCVPNQNDFNTSGLTRWWRR